MTAVNPEAKYFFVKLNPPRPTFPADMTEAEGAVMQQHGAYWRELTSKGLVVVFGVVIDPEYTHGVGILEVESEERVRELLADDPVTRAALGRYEIHPMRVGSIRGQTA